MSLYYHLTPERNVRRVLRKGLVPATSSMMAVEGMEEEDTRGKIFLGRDVDECLLCLHQIPITLDPESPAFRVRHWALLEVTLPSSWELHEDVYGFLYSKRRIPPEYIGVFHLDSTSDRSLKSISEDTDFSRFWEERGLV